MKEFFKKMDSETLFGGIFGVVALVAILVEMIIGGFDNASVAGGIKDISGTVVTIIMLFVAIKALRPEKKKDENFDEIFENKMKEIIKKYEPVISFYAVEEIKGKNMKRYNIANKLDAISTNEPGANNKFFRISAGETEVEFSVSETVFPGRREAAASRISSKLALSHNDFIADIRQTKTGFVLVFKEPLTSEDNAVKVSSIVDHAILLYIAEYKKP